MGKNDLIAYGSHSPALGAPVQDVKGNLQKQSRPPELKARVLLKYKDDPALYEQILKIILLALAIADMDKEEAEKYQKTYFANL